ncbi:MAG: cytochrome c oxidase subunit II [Armatimonadetes bacterium]|nr:cytochrome c oxidase subunit II [Armatimonadota bacterium]
MRAAANTTDLTGNAMAWIFGVCVFLMVAVTATMIAFAIIYNRKRRPRVENIEGHLVLEIVWTVVPLIIVLWIFWLGYSSYLPQRKGPANALVVEANGVMWAWSFTYPNGHTDTKLRLPVNQPVKIVTQSVDVIHSFYVPDFRIKQDAVPNRKNHIFFTPQRVGTSWVFCAEYCGKLHSQMKAEVEIQPREEFDRWYQSTNSPSAAAPATTTQAAPQPVKPTAPVAPSGEAKPAAAAPDNALIAQGEKLYTEKGCNVCHSVTGSKMIGPSWKGLYGHDVKVLVNGKPQTVKADDAYITESIHTPGAKVVEGFQNVMPPQQLSADETRAMIAYIQSLK